MMNAFIVLMDRNNVEGRSAVTLTLLLTTVAFQFLLLPEARARRAPRAAADRAPDRPASRARASLSSYRSPSRCRRSAT
jgi:hypothetical protein